MRLGARGTSRLTSQLRLALEPKCLDEPTTTTREDPQDGADSIEDTQAACDFRYWASKLTPFFQMCKVIAAILRASVRRAISGRMPLVSNAVSAAGRVGIRAVDRGSGGDQSEASEEAEVRSQRCSIEFLRLSITVVSSCSPHSPVSSTQNTIA